MISLKLVAHLPRDQYEPTPKKIVVLSPQVTMALLNLMLLVFHLDFSSCGNDRQTLRYKLTALS